LRTATDSIRDLTPDPVEGDAEIRQGGRCYALLLPKQAQQEVFGADIWMVELPGLVLGKDDGPACTVSESLEHDAPFHRPRPS
jgi:hypothetical protein